MTQRAGRTEKVSVSIDAEALAKLRKRAARFHDGNLSAVFNELAVGALRLDAMRALARKLGAPPLSDAKRAALARERDEAPVGMPARGRRSRSAA
jgi:hypothetical protein